MRLPRRPSAPLVHEVAALERTALAWERTAISLAAVGLLLVKLVDVGLPTETGGVVLVGLAIAVVLVVVPVGYRRARGRVEPQRLDAPFTVVDRWRPRMLLVTALAVSATALAVGADVLASMWR